MQENENIYVSSRGILKSCDYHSLTPISSIRYFHNYPPISEIKNKSCCSIYVCGSAIPHFIMTILPSINFPFVLVSGDCDDTIPDEILKPPILNIFLDDNRLKRWFSQNMIINHPKIIKIPIGLDYHTLTQRPLWGPISSCKDQEQILRLIKKKSLPFWDRKLKCYANFHFSMNTKLGYDRKDAFNEIKKDLIYYEEKKIQRIVTWNKQKDFTFVICPHGGGLDCHRNWEALCLGCIPIVKTSQIDDLYKDLPVLVVKQWHEIDLNLLTTTLQDFKQKFNDNQFKMEKMTLGYWIKLIRKNCQFE